MKNNKILVTGGAGYIGSHVVRQLGAAGESVITLDNLSTGFAAAVTSGALVVGDTGDATNEIRRDLSRLQRVCEVLGWAPRYDDLDTIVNTALAWERKIAAQDPTAYWAA